MEALDKANLAKTLLTAKLSKRKPIVVHINCTNYCNLRCPYCYWGTEKAVKSEEFTTQELIALVDELFGMGCRRINWGAGEPLMRKDIGKLLDHCKNKGILTNINTNGHLVVQKLKEIRNVTTICIAIDGIEATHDAGKGRGSYKKVLEAIRAAKDAGIKVHTSTCLTKDNVQDVEHILRLSKRIGFTTEWLLPFFQTQNDFLAGNEEYRKAISTIIAYKKKGYPIITSFKSLEYTRDWPDYQKRSARGRLPKNGIPCYAGRYMCIINSDGKVYPCSQMIDTEFEALDFRKVGFRKAWDNLMGHDCKTCYAFMAFNDYNMLIDWDMATIWNYAMGSLTGNE